MLDTCHPLAPAVLLVPPKWLEPWALVWLSAAFPRGCFCPPASSCVFLPSCFQSFLERSRRCDLKVVESIAGCCQHSLQPRSLWGADTAFPPGTWGTCWGIVCIGGTQLAFTLASPVIYGHAWLVFQVLGNSFLLHVGGVSFLSCRQKASASSHCETKLPLRENRSENPGFGTRRPPVMCCVGVRPVQGPSALLPAGPPAWHVFVL